MDLESKWASNWPAWACQLCLHFISTPSSLRKTRLQVGWKDPAAACARAQSAFAFAERPRPHFCNHPAGGVGGGFAMDADGRTDGLAALARSPFRSPPLSLTMMPSLSPPSFLSFLSRGRLARPRTMTTRTHARSLALSPSHCEVFSREKCATHANSEKRPSAVRQAVGSSAQLTLLSGFF